MTVTIAAKNYNLINACEDENNWTGETPSDVIDFYKEGTQCIGFEITGAGNNDTYISVTEDLSGVTHLRAWFMCAALKELNTDANGGIQFYLGDGTNIGYWYVSGSDTYLGGWYNLVVDLSKAPFDQVNLTILGNLEANKVPCIIVGNKMDLPNAKENSDFLNQIFPELDIILISALDGTGVKELYSKIAEVV